MTALTPVASGEASLAILGILRKTLLFPSQAMGQILEVLVRATFGGLHFLLRARSSALHSEGVSFLGFIASKADFLASGG